MTCVYIHAQVGSICSCGATMYASVWKLNESQVRVEEKDWLFCRDKAAGTVNRRKRDRQMDGNGGINQRPREEKREGGWKWARGREDWKGERKSEIREKAIYPDKQTANFQKKNDVGFQKKSCRRKMCHHSKPSGDPRKYHIILMHLTAAILESVQTDRDTHRGTHISFPCFFSFCTSLSFFLPHPLLFSLLLPCKHTHTQLHTLCLSLLTTSPPLSSPSNLRSCGNECVMEPRGYQARRGIFSTSSGFHH